MMFKTTIKEKTFWPGKCFIVIGLSFGLMLWGCAVNPPLDEMAAAKLALEEARNAQAQIYAGDEYRAAEETLQFAEEEAAKEHHKRALTLSRKASMEAKYALEHTKWKIKDNQLKEAQVSLQKTMEEAEHARLSLEEAKGKLY